MARTRWLVTAFLLGRMLVSLPAGASELLTPDERAWLQAHENQVRWCPILNYAPIDFVDGDGRPAGLSADYLARIQEMLGFRIRVESCGDWMEILEKLRDRRLDLVAAIEQTPDREEYLTFTRPYITIPVVILTREDLDRDLTLASMAGMHVAVPAGYATVGWVRRNYPEVVVVPTRDDPEALQAVSLGRADAALVDLAVASYFIGRLGITNLRVAGYSGFEWNLRFGIRSDWPELARILDKALAAISGDEKEAMQRRWIGLIEKPFYLWPAVWWTSVGVVGAVGLLFASVIVWNRSLARQVRERTGELEGELARRRRAEADAETARQILTAVLEGMDALVFVADMETHEVLFANARMREAFGTDPVGRRCWEVFRHRDGPCDHCTNPRLVGPDGKIGSPVVWEGRNPVTGRVYLNCDRAIRWVDGRLVRLETSTDITERKSLEARLREAQKMEAVGTLAGGIAHDFNNILAVVLGNAELVLSREPADPELRRRLERILEASERARQVVAQLLAFCRKTEGSWRPVDAARAVADTLVLLRAAIPANVQIEESIAPDAGAVLADPAGLQRVVMNLVTNAYQAVRGSGGRVTVTVGSARQGQRDGVVLVVEDDGPGISEELIPRIFEPYFTTKEVGQGSGLGLAVVRGMVDAAGGTVEVDSEPGRGTRFTVWLPRAQEGAGGAPWPAGVPRGAGQRVLVVDDEPGVAEATAAVLEGLGYRTRWATDPDEALELVRSAPKEWDLVVTDQTMPGLMGTELCHRIREVRADLPVILCTGYSEALDEPSAAGVGASVLLFKPVVSRDLARAVSEALGS